MRICSALNLGFSFSKQSTEFGLNSCSVFFLSGYIQLNGDLGPFMRARRQKLDGQIRKGPVLQLTHCHSILQTVNCNYHDKTLLYGQQILHPVIPIALASFIVVLILLE